MAQQTVVKRSAAAATANTDTTLFTPPAGVRVKILTFYVVNEGAAQVAGMDFELRFGSNIIALAGLMVAAAPIGQMSNVVVLAHEVIGDGVTAIVARNLTTLNTSAIAAYVVAYDANYLP
jgi:hypothetical protein